jgi:SNF2 family DNA or RNA helicase
MFEFQNDGVAHLRAHERAFLGDEPGLGKSRQALLAAGGRTLVVAPAMVLDGGVWTDEVAKWAPELDVTFAPYSSLNRLEKGPRGGNVPTDFLRPEWDQAWDTVILDESHYVKGRKTSWTKAAMKLQTGQLFMMSGTPIPNWAHEVFTTSQLLFPTEAKKGGRFGSYWRWAKEWFEVNPTRYSPMAVGDPLEDTPEFWLRFHEACLGDRYLARTWEDVLTDVPPLRFQQIDCPMKPAQLKAYRELKKQYQTVTDSGLEVVAWSSGGVHVRLAKVCTGLELLDPVSPASGKFEVLEDQLRMRSGQVLVVAHFKDTCDLVAAVARNVGKSAVIVHGDVGKAQRIAALRAFKAGEVDVLAGSIETVAEGQNFEAVHTVIRVERSWKPSRNKQVARRIRRISNLSPKLCIDLVTPRSVDASMLPVLEAKTDQQVKALRARELMALL